MITQQINISFTSAMAETIRIHTGESGRQIIFTPDFLEAIPNDHGADVIIVKPDNTFVIAAASIDTDGKIYVTIPEQAGAVSGVGNYILKVYDNDNLCIYSACGGFYIDDHLLTDEMLESIAEVYGYQFPQDFALKDEAATLNDNVTATNSTWSSSKIAEEIAEASTDPSTFIDDNEVLYDKTWSSEKISYELGNIQPYHVYTTTEQPVGRWIDGSTVYEKTIYFNGLSRTSDWTELDSSVAYGKLISADGIRVKTNECFSFNNGLELYPRFQTKTDGKLYYYTNSNYDGDFYITIRYTKTTD